MTNDINPNSIIGPMLIRKTNEEVEVISFDHKLDFKSVKEKANRC